MQTVARKPSVTDQSCPRGFQLVAGDIEILRHIHSHRLLHLDSLHILTSRSNKTLSRRLRKLKQHKFIHHYHPEVPKHIYTLGKAAVPILAEQGILPLNVVGNRTRHELNDLFLKHESMIAEFHVLLTVASRAGLIKLVDWREGSALYDHVSLMKNGEPRLRQCVKPLPGVPGRARARREPPAAAAGRFCEAEACHIPSTHSRIPARAK
jgi:Replication-relaxation